MLSKPSLPENAKWCQPGDVQHAQHFLIRYDDPDRSDAVYTDWGRAREHYARATLSWNCWMFAAVPASVFNGDHTDLEAENARLRGALRGLLDCPDIADNDYKDEETHAAERAARALLRDLEGRT